MAGVVLGFLKYVLGFDSLAFQEGATNAQKELKRLEREFKKSADGISEFGTRMSVAVTAPLVGIAALGLNEAKATAQAMAQVNAALSSMGGVAGRTAEQLSGFADQLELNSLFEADEILQKVTANLLTFGNVTGSTFDQAQQAIVDLSTRMGTDLQSATILVGRALNEPVKGLTALRRTGIQFSEAQVAAVEAMVATNNIAGAQGVILAELNKQFGNAAAAAQATDPWNRATDAFKQMAEQIGTALLPVLPVISEAVVSLTQAFTSLSPETQKYVIIAGGLLAAIGPLAVGLGAVMTALAPARAAFAAAAAGIATIGPASAVATAGMASGSAAATGFAARLTGLAAAATTAGRALLGMFGGPLGAAILGVGAALAYASSESFKLRGVTEQTRQVQGAATASAERLQGAINSLATSYGRAREEALALIRSERQLAAHQYSVASARAQAAGTTLGRIRNASAGVGGRGASALDEARALAEQEFTAARQAQFLALRTLNSADQALANPARPRAAGPVGGGGAGSAAGGGAGGGGGRSSGGGGAAQQTRDAEAAVREFTNALGSLREQYLPVATAEAEMIKRLSTLSRAFKEGEISGTDFTIMAAAVRNEFANGGEGATDWADAVSDAMGESQSAIEQWRASLPTTQEALSDLSQHFEEQARALEESAQRQRRALDDMVYGLRTFANSIKSGDIFGIIEGIFGLFDAIGGMTNGGRGFNLGPFQFGGARADGGPVASGRTYLVGERGPELFTPSRSGAIIANDNMRGGGRVHVTIDAGPGIHAIARDEAGRIVGQTAPAIANAGAAIAQRSMAQRNKYTVAG